MADSVVPFSRSLEDGSPVYLEGVPSFFGQSVQTDCSAVVVLFHAG